MISRKLLSLLISLPILTYGQGFYKVSQSYISTVKPDEVNELDLTYSDDEISYYLENENHNVLSLNKDGFQKINIEDDLIFPSMLKDGNTMYSLRKPFISKYILKDSIFVKKKTIRLPKSFVHRGFIPTASFQDDNYLYFICYYNKNQITNNHDNSYWLKIDKKKFKIVEAKELFVGKEILLAPLNMQLLAFNQKHFILSSPLKHELYLIDKDFNAFDTIQLNKKLALQNIAKLDSVFPNSTLYYYSDKAKEVIDRSIKSGLISSGILYKTAFINDSLLALCVSVRHRDRYKLQVYNLNSKTLFWETEFNFRDSVFGSFAYTTKLYFIDQSKFASMRTVAINDSTESYLFTLYGFTPEKPINRDELLQFQILNKNLHPIDLTSYKAIIIADYTYCKACYLDFGLGEEVLLIYQEDILERPRLNTSYNNLKRNWNVQGEIGFVDKATLEAMLRQMKRNTILPLSE